MAQTDYSAGPFYVTDTGEAIRVRQEASDAVLATMDDGGHPELELIPYAEQLANAHLFAAAPELLEALQALRAMVDQRWPGADLSRSSWAAPCAQADAAIAKATGASS